MFHWEQSSLVAAKAILQFLKLLQRYKNNLNHYRADFRFILYLMIM